jgi:3-oxoacyl-[acyl-carrier protein] reductase
VTGEQIFISGGSSDIGLALISQLAASPNPPRVLAHCHAGAERLEELRRELPASAQLVILPCDFESEPAVRALAGRVIEEFGCPNWVVHLPGLKLVYERFFKFRWEHFESDLAVQLRSAIVLLGCFLPLMTKLANARVVFLLSSVTHGVPPKYLSMYNVIKFSQLGLMRSLASEYGGGGLTINAVSAGMMETRFLDNVPDIVRQYGAAASPKNRNATVAEVASAIAYLLSPAAAYIHGVDLLVAGGAVF